MLWLVRNPILFEFNEMSAALKHLKSVKCRNAQLQMRLIHSPEILIRAEHHDLIVHCAVCLRPLKAFNRIVQCGIGRVDFKWLIRHDFRSLPSAIIQIKIDLKHVICLHGTKCIHMVWSRLLLQHSPFLNL